MKVCRVLIFLVACGISIGAAERIWTFRAWIDWGAHGYLDKEGYAQGLYHDLIDIVCAEAKMDCRVVADNFTNCWQPNPGDRASPGKGLMSGRYDGCVGWTPTIERLHSFSFSLPFIAQKPSYFYVPKGKNFDVYDLAGKNIVFIGGLAADEHCLAKQSNIANNILTYSQISYKNEPKALMMTLMSGQADALFTKGEILPATSPFWRVLNEIKTPFYCGVSGEALMARKDNPVVAVWNTGFRKLIDTNKYTKFCAESIPKHEHMGPLKCL